MDTGEPQDRLEELEARIRRIEGRLGLKWMDALPPVPPDPSAVQDHPHSPKVIAYVAAKSTPDSDSASSPADDPRQSWSDLEQIIGQRWASIAGALTFVIGMGLLFTVAWRRGWFGHVPPEVKCIAGALLGLCMLVAAEYVRKKINALAAIGLNAAGLGVVYLSAYVAFDTFHLLTPGAAFALLASVAVLGIAISARAKFASVGIVALVAGYLTPFLVDSDHPSPWIMPIHLTVMLGLGLGLTGWRGPNFAGVRTTALLGTLIIGALWALGTASLPLTPVLLFAGAAWALINLEACRAVTIWAQDTLLAQNSAKGSILGAVIATAWAVIVSVLAIEHTPGAALDWTAPLTLAIASGALAWGLVPNIRALLARPSSLAEILACVLACQALALVPVSIALAWSGWLRLAAWGFIAVASAVAARHTNLWSLAIYAWLLLCVTTLPLVLVDSWNDDQLSVGTLVQGVYLSRWMATAAVLAAAWLVVARLIGFNTGAPAPISPPWRRRIGRLSAISGATLALILWFHTKTELRSLTFVLPVVASALLSIRRIWPGLWVDRTASVGILFTAALWLGTYITEGWLNNSSAIFLHPGLWSSFLVAGAALLAGWLTDNPCGSPYRRKVFLEIAWSLAGSTLFISTSFEIARVAKLLITDNTARSAAVSVWWTVLAIALIVGGFAIHRPWPRRVGLGLLALALAKVVLYDLAAVSLEWRTVSFLVLGSVMLAVGLVYGRVAKRMDAMEQPTKSPEQPPPTPLLP
ncbi:MAG: DUF2339 domain-containing protein [Planctomycetota bacterium]